MLNITLKKTNAEAAGFVLSNNTRFALLSPDNKQVMTPVSCRAFLEEVVWAYKTKNKVPRTDFVEETLMFDVKQARMSVKFPDQKTTDIFLANLSKLTAWEKKHGIEITQAIPTQEAFTFVMLGDKNWVTYTWKVSVWSFLIKALGYATMENLQSPESGYWSGCRNTIETILAHVPMEHDEKQLGSAGTVHSNGGIRGINSGDNPNSKWVRDESNIVKPKKRKVKEVAMAIEEDF